MAQTNVGPGRLVTELAGLFKKEGIVKPPQWAAFVKTGAQAQRPPANPDWWYVRAASVLWQVYRRGPLGVGKLRGWYGGKKKRGTKPEMHYRAGGKVIRLCLQQLEAAGLLAKEGAGRKVTPKGQAMVDKLSNSLRPRYEKKAPVEKAAKKPKGMTLAQHGVVGMTMASGPSSSSANAQVRQRPALEPSAEAPAEAPAKKPRAKKPKPESAEAAAPTEAAVPEAVAEKPKKRAKKVAGMTLTKGQRPVPEGA